MDKGGENQPQCPRTLALYQPGVPKGFPCHFVYAGKVPCTGPLICPLCGTREDSA
jgi:hypothetical protein